MTALVFGSRASMVQGRKGPSTHPARFMVPVQLMAADGADHNGAVSFGLVADVLDIQGRAATGKTRPAVQRTMCADSRAT
ncbi:MAG: hypothetical protein ACLFQC_12070 [Wenzhouxiangella sp.]